MEIENVMQDEEVLSDEEETKEVKSAKRFKTNHKSFQLKTDDLEHLQRVLKLASIQQLAY